MGYTKRQFIVDALTEIGLGASVLDASPEDLESALRRLDSMMGMWASRGLTLGYPLAPNPSMSSLDQETGVPDYAIEGVITNLAVKIAPSYGKSLPRETKVAAHESFRNISRQVSSASPPKKRLPSNLPVGQGYKTWRNSNAPFYRPGPQPVDANAGGELELY